jgi:hypothetical protein
MGNESDGSTSQPGTDDLEVNQETSVSYPIYIRSTPEQVWRGFTDLP